MIRWNKQDLLIFTPNGSEWSTVVYPCSSLDEEFGGSIHNMARQSLLDAVAG
ncbi:hypothetical protein [Roseateles sp. LKC17W]|uniref:Uncharacterized protein n=1 Tax=Pelomonas margarita TaxID=3299031 RepID=A0ABW7FQB7_9BURK